MRDTAEPAAEARVVGRSEAGGFGGSVRCWVPPGSVQAVTGTFCPVSQSTSMRHWVDFPVPSRPSNERNTGFGIGFEAMARG